MLVDINLLPQKEKRNSTTAVVFILIIILAAGCGGYLWFEQKQLTDHEKRLQTELAAVQQLKSIVQQNPNSPDNPNAEEKLQTALAWAENYPVSTYKLLRHITSLLPERGFVLSFSYQESGNVQLSVQFDSSRDAAFFFKSMQESEFIQNANLLSITTERVSSESESDLSILPRYIAQYTVLIDKNAIKQVHKSGEGGS
jgi:type IV pilus assembly protein PilN